MDFVEYRTRDDLTPQELKDRLACLMRWYTVRRSPWLALAVATLLDDLCRHPDYDGTEADRCACHRSVSRWRYLAGSDRQLVQASV